MNDFLIHIVEWIALLFEYMDDIIIFSAGDLFEYDISLLDVSFSIMIVFAVVRLIFDVNDIEIDD